MRIVYTLLATTLSFLLFSAHISFAQNLTLQSGPVSPAEMFVPAEKMKPLFSNQLIEGKYHILIQFQQIPHTSQKQQMQQEGIDLLTYLPENTFIASIDQRVDWDELSTFGVTQALVFQGCHKLSRELADHNYPGYALVGQQIQLRLLPYPDISQKTFTQQLQNAGYQPEQGIDLRSALSLTIPLHGIDKLASLPVVMYVEAGAAPSTLDGLRGRTSHRANWLSQKPGTGYDGTGVVMAIADDGGVNHIDFTGRLTDHTTSQGGTHGDMTGGIAAGAGNVDPTAAGMGTGAYLHMYGISGYPQINNAIENFDTLGIVITSTSYSQGCGGVYDGSAQSLDLGVDSIPVLLHVFSAGNSASSNCSSVYGSLRDANGYRYGNITGGRKAAKHSIATANMEYDDDRTLSSSRGPCEDGRLKPDISAHGTGQISTRPNNTYAPGGGTSAAAPGIAGVSTMLYQAYKEMNNGTNPPSSLIKGILLNSADDLGRPGPDYDFGWGRVNARRALEVLEDSNYATHQISQGDTNTHTFTIPANVKEVKVMMYWHDPAGSPLASKALVNDLDMHIFQGNSHWFPWQLSTDAHIDSLQKNAWKGADHVNNMEQVAWNNPTQGSYTIEVVGNAVPDGPQAYHINYVFIYDEIIVSYPRGGESFVPGVEETIRWEAVGSSGNFQIQYSINNGLNWQNIANSVNGDRRHFDWEVDSVLTGRARVRVLRSGRTGISDAAFSIMQVPQNTRAKAISATEGQLEWDAVPGATKYAVFVLGNKYMDSVGSTNNTFYPFSNLVQGINFWCSVRARDTVGNIIGRRIIALEYDHNPVTVCASCPVPIDTFPYIESFENSYENWCELFTDDLDWTQRSDSTPSRNTGPQGAIHGDKYLYIEASNPNFPEKTAIIGSPCFDLSNFAKGHFIFSYHMYGSTMGDLYLEASTDRGATWSSPVWSKSGNQGNQWKRDSVDLNAYLGGVVAFRFRGETGTNWSSDIAIDYVVVKEDPVCATFDVQGVSSDITCFGYEDGAISISASGGTAGYIYNWQHGAIGPGLANLATGTYEVIVEDANGCRLGRQFTINEPDSLQLQLQPTPISCHGGNDGALAATVTGGNGGNGFVWSTGSQGFSINSLSAGTYTLLVNDQNGCTAQGSYSFVNPPPILISFNANDPLCHGDATGSIQTVLSGIHGTPTYRWSTGDTVGGVNGLPAGNYSLAITDSLGCIGTGNTTLQDPPAITMQLQSNPTSCFAYQDGSASGVAFGGAGNFQYQWLNGPTSPSRGNLSAGTYTLIVTDNNGCVSTDSVVVSQPSQLTVSAVGLDLKCFGDSSGRAIASGGGGTAPYTYLWSQGSTTPTLSNLPIGNYVVTITDANNCQTNDLISIRQPTALQLQITSTDESIPSANDGTATPMISGGTPPYVSFQWSNGGRDSVQQALAAGIYTVTVTDANGCMITDSVIVGSVNAIDDKPALQEFKLYPNPSENKITIEFTLTSKELTKAQIVDALGRSVWELKIQPTAESQKIEIDISTWASGTYFLQIQNTTESASHRFIKY